jgi:hypothetical protein
MDFSSFLQRLPMPGAFSKNKDALVGLGAKEKANQIIQPYGEVVELRLNSAARTLSATLQLKGETSPVDISVREYSISRNEKGQTVVSIDGRHVETSREWLTKLINDKLGEQNISVPERFGWLVRVLM